MLKKPVSWIEESIANFGKFVWRILEEYLYILEICHCIYDYWRRQNAPFNEELCIRQAIFKITKHSYPDFI